MAASLTTQPAWLMRSVNRWLIYGVEVFLWLLVVVFLFRRLQSAFVQPLDAVPLWLALGFMALFSAIARALLSETPGQKLALQASLRLALCSLVLSVPGISWLSIAGAWFIVALDFAWAFAFLRRSVHPSSRRTTTPSSDEQFVRRTTHFVDENGTPYITGTLHLTFAADQRILCEYLSFCPPFSQTPEIQVEQTAGPTVRVKVSQTYPYASRLEFKAPASSAAQTVELEWTAFLPASHDED